MNIAIDASLLKINLAGMGIYVKEMVELMSKFDHDNNFYLFTNADFACQLNVGKNFHIIKSNIKPHIVWLQLFVPFLIKKYKIDVFWQPDHILPPKVKGCDYFVTVHDLSAYKYRDVAMKRVEIVYKLFLKQTCKDAKRIITISKYTKEDIVSTIGIEENKINVIYNGDSPYELESEIEYDEQQKCLLKYKIEKPYFLFVGTINPRKNVITIIKAFEILKEKYNIDVKLVLVGEYGWNSDDVLDAIEQSEFREDIVKTGFVSESEKEVFYRNAIALVFPSILEGFGLPVLEAMSVGIPVITSNNSSLPEVGGDVAYYIDDCKDYIELAKKMKEIAGLNKNERERISNNSVIQSQKFSRKKCAKETLELITNHKIN